MKRILSIFLAVMMIASLCAVNTGAIDLTYTGARGLYQVTSANYSSFIGRHGSCTCEVKNFDNIATNGYVDIVSDPADGDPQFSLKMANNEDPTYAYATYKVFAVCMKVPAGATLANPWWYARSITSDGKYADFGGGGNIANPYFSTPGEGKWVTHYITIADCSFPANCVAMARLRVGGVAGSDTPLSVAWFGMFESQADAETYSNLYKTQYNLTDDAPVEKTEKVVTTAEFTPSRLTFEGIANGALVNTVNIDNANWDAYMADPDAYTATRFTAESNGNVYGTIGSFWTMNNHNWFAPTQAYTFETDIRALDANDNHFRGMLVNFGQEVNNLGDLCMETNGIDANYFVGKSGVGIHWIDDTTMRIFALTYSDGTLGEIHYDCTVPELSASEWNHVAVSDNGAGKIDFKVNNALIGSITYADPSMSDNSDLKYCEQYYRSLAILDANGEEVAITAIGIMSIYKSMAMGSRTAGYQFDNIEVSPIEADHYLNGAIGSAEGTVGDTITVPVTLAGNADQKIASAHIKVKYDPTKLAFVAIADTANPVEIAGDIFASFGAGTLVTVDAENGLIDLILQNGTGTEVVESVAQGALVNLKFTALAETTEGTTTEVSYVAANLGDDFCYIDASAKTVGDYEAVITSGALTIAPAAVQAPTEIKTIEGSTYYFHQTYTDVLVAVPTLSAGITVEAFLANIADASYMQVTTADGTAVDATANIKTGYIVNLVVNGAVVDSKEIAVLYDGNKSGSLNSTDIRTLRTAMVKGTTDSLAPAVYAALDVRHTGSLNSTDYRNLKTGIGKLA